MATKVIVSGYTDGVTMGGDPEIFLSRKGKIIGSENAIPSGEEEGQPSIPQVIRDGVQVEFVLPPFTCRQNGGGQVAKAFRALRMHLLNNHPDLRIDFRQVVEVEKDEMDGLSDKSRLLGCAPSRNFYDPDATTEVDPAKYLKRSAGGHIHLGLATLRGTAAGNGFAILEGATKDNTNHPAKFIRVLDALVGNTCVLIDRDEGAAERRKVYGRAGEYRLPVHGLEYRTLSNFWLRSYPLASLVWGMARLSTSIVYHSIIGPPVIAKQLDSWGHPRQVVTKAFETPTWDIAQELITALDTEKVREAINRNDKALALENWKIVREFLEAYTVGSSEVGDGAIPLVASTLEDFEYFLEKGLDHWFPKGTALIRWLCLGEMFQNGWEGFLTDIVRPRRIASGVKITHCNVKTRSRKKAA